MAFINILKNCKIPVRFGIAVMLFMICLICYVARVNFTFNVISMVKPENSTKEADEEEDDDGVIKRYKWNNYEQGILLGAYFWGYLLSSLPSGILAERFGGMLVAGCASLFSAALTILTPFAPDIDFWVLFLVRLLIGVFGGFIYPSCHNLISKWAPPDEKGKFVASLMGGTFGTVITWPICGIIISYMNWAWAFIIPGIFCGAVAVLWFILVSNEPSKHKCISEEEKKYIEDSLTGGISKRKKFPPFCKMITSLPFWALLILHFGNMWGLYFFITAVPLYMSKALQFNLTAAGFLSSLPNLARIVAAFIFGCIGDCVRKKGHLSLTTIRKCFCLFSHIIPGILLVILAYFAKEPSTCVAIITLSLGFNGAATVTNLQNAQDLAPNYAATLYGIINCVGTTSGIFSPLIVAHFTKEDQTTEGWKHVFLIGAAVYILPAIFYAIFGSAKVQKWNSSEEKNEGEVKNEA